MAENQQPLDSAPIPPRIDLAAVTKSRKRIQPTPTPSPMSSARIYNIDTQPEPARIQLISPPPEETLRRVSRSTPFTPSLLADPTPNPTSKRKRSQHRVASAPPCSPTAKGSFLLPEVTPNPKPRKQSKRHVRSQSMESPTRPPPRSSQHEPTTPSKSSHTLVKSPHADKPDADYIPPIPLSLLADGPSRRATISARARRSATPVPPYEPPKDVFTPPREVFVTPTISKSSKRKSTHKGTSTVGKTRKKAQVKVKLEMPDIDLDTPMPPASPSEDPILLSGSVEPSSPIKPREPTRVDAGVDTSSPFDELTSVTRVHVFDWNRHTEPEGSTDFSSMDLDPADADVPPLPLFDLNDLPPSSDGGWTDSDDEAPPGPGNPDWDGIEGVGEYTGKWRMMKVRTKTDPPSSATRNRMEEWGRPISPFPQRIRRLELVGEEDEDDSPQERSLEDILTGDQDKEMEEEERREEEEVRRMSVEPEQDGEHIESATVHGEEPQANDQVPQEVQQAHSSQEEETEREERQRVDSVVGSDHVDAAPPLAEKADEAIQIEPETIPNDQQDRHSPEGPSRSQEESDDEREELEVRQMSVECEPEEDHEEQSNVSVTSIATIVQEEPPVTPETGTLSQKLWSYEDQRLHEPSSPIELRKRATHQQATESYIDTFVSLRDHTVDEDMPMENALDDDDDEDDTSDSSDSEEVGVVKITSADPRAAARAVAILKQYDYDCFTKVVTKRRHAEAKRRRGSHSAVDDIVKEFRRKNLQGVSKESQSEKKRRRSLGMSIIGDHVLIPGSPAITIPDLLKEAEAEVEVVTGHTSGIWVNRAETHDPFKTPLPSGKTLPSILPDLEAGVREWTKEEWKLLDGCFTDERLDAGHRLDLGDENGLAPVDIVRIENVVQRFIDTLGGDKILSLYGDAWSRENLLKRAKALQNKQRAGHVAPPVTPNLLPSRSAGFNSTRQVPAIEVPEFTPLRRRPAPPRKQRPATVARDVDLSKKKVPSSLLAPRYSHLLEEAITISREEPSAAPAKPEDQDHDEEQDEIEETESILASPERAIDYDEPPVPPPSIGKRVKGFFFSYLPTVSRTPAPTRLKKPAHPGLPLPPPDVLESRGPVATPIRPEVPKPIPPKELVHLHPAPAPAKPSMIPRAVNPRRLVELRPAPPPSPVPVPTPRPRRSSGGSVKDLVRSFEVMQARASLDAKPLQKVKSIGDLRGDDKSRPTWKP